jgi:predicted dehydrogenase
MGGMQSVRVGIIGMGNMGRHHADYLLAGKAARCELKAVCSTSPQKLDQYKENVAVFGHANELMRSGVIDAVVIATPHPQHPAQGIAALENGLHVIVEKPIAAHKADAERLIAAAQKRPRQIFAAMFQLRVEPRYARLRKLIESGELGAIARVSWIITDWYRTEAYYASGGWRATWKGEGGGVLINQCLHQLDMLQWLCGMPARVRGFCQLGRYHNVEVEDNITCYLEWPNNATGIFVSSTGEAPGSNRFEIAGTRGKVVLENNKLTFTRNETDMIEFSKAAPTGFSKPEVWVADLPFETNPTPHATLMQNFADAILDGATLIAPGQEGLGSIELANAMLYSSLMGETVELPMEGAAYEKKLQQLIANSKFQKTVKDVAAEDFTRSFNR